jgi:hypothetical protein
MENVEIVSAILAAGVLAGKNLTSESGKSNPTPDDISVIAVQQYSAILYRVQKSSDKTTHSTPSRSEKAFG